MFLPAIFPSWKCNLNTFMPLITIDILYPPTLPCLVFYYNLTLLPSKHSDCWASGPLSEQVGSDKPMDLGQEIFTEIGQVR